MPPHRRSFPKWEAPTSAAHEDDHIPAQRTGSMGDLMAPSVTFMPLPEGFTPFPTNSPPEKVGTRPQLASALHVACFDKDEARVRAVLAEGSAAGNKVRANLIDVGSAPLPLSEAVPFQPDAVLPAV